jgi:hypothetical protein
MDDKPTKEITGPVDDTGHGQEAEAAAQSPTAAAQAIAISAKEEK